MAMAMISIVLLIALFNVVGLLLARAVDCEREMTLRGALGASRARLTQQLVTESLVIATAGGALALFVSRWSNTLLATFAPEAPVPQRIDVTPDWTVVAFTAGLMIICGIGAGLLPARRATSLAIATAMAPPTVIGGARAGRLRAIVVSMQVAGATLLLTMASLLVRDAMAAAAVSVGFDTAHGIVLEVDPASHGYAEPAAQQFVADAITTFRATPGVVSAAVMNRVPFYVGFPVRLDVSVDGRLCAMETCPTAASYRIGPDYFTTMNIALRRGRETRWLTRGRAIGGDQRNDGQELLALSRSGRTVGEPGADGRRAQVVGVAADTVHRTIGERPEPYVYLPFEQPEYAERLAIVLRTSGDPQPLLRTVSEQLRAMDPSLPIYQLRTMRQRIDAREQSGRLIIVRFFGICGGLALFLSIVGLTGTVSGTLLASESASSAFAPRLAPRRPTRRGWWPAARSEWRARVLSSACSERSCSPGSSPAWPVDSTSTARSVRNRRVAPTDDRRCRGSRAGPPRRAGESSRRASH